MKIKTGIFYLMFLTLFACNLERNNELVNIIKIISSRENCEFGLISDEIKKEVYIISKCQDLNTPEYGRVLLDFGKQILNEKIDFLKIGIKNKTGQLKMRLTKEQLKILLSKKDEFEDVLIDLQENQYKKIYNKLDENLSKNILESDFAENINKSKDIRFNRFNGLIIAKVNYRDYVSFYSTSSVSNITLTLSLDPEDRKIYGLNIIQ